MKLSKRQINALNRSGRAEYDARLGDLLGEALNKGVGAIIVEADGSVPINDAMEGVPFESMIIPGGGRMHEDKIEIVVTNGEESKEILIDASDMQMESVSSVADEIDLGKGVYIQRIGYNGEEYIPLDKEIITPLSDDVKKAFKELTPYGENMSVYCSQDYDVKFSYVADTKKYIDKKVAEIQAIILEGQVM